MALKGIKALEFVGLAPAPMCGLILSDFGANVLRLDSPHNPKSAYLSGTKNTMYVDLKNEQGIQIVRKLVTTNPKMDVLIDPFRPGVLERLNLGPELLLKDNPKLVYARLSGYGQTGPLANKAGHDINYIALAGVLSRMGFNDRPPIGPLNLLGDFGGGGLMCALGIVMALFERERSGLGQVVDTSITEGTAYLSTFLWETLQGNESEILWPHKSKRGSNLLDYGAPFYRCYQTADGKFMAVGALEEKFYQEFVKTIGLDIEKLDSRFDPESWPILAEKIEQIFMGKTRSEWEKIFDTADCCVTPVLDQDEVIQLPQHKHREAFGEIPGENKVPNPAPILSRTPATKRDSKNDSTGKTLTRTILEELGYSKENIAELSEEGVIDDESNQD